MCFYMYTKKSYMKLEKNRINLEFYFISAISAHNILQKRKEIMNHTFIYMKKIITDAKILLQNICQK